MYHMNEKELYLYSIIRRYEDREHSYLTSIRILNNATQLTFAKREDHAVKIIKETLESLYNKGILNVVSPEGELINIKSLKANDLIYIVIKIGNTKGHVQIPYEQLKQFESMSDYYIYCAVRRWDNNGGFGCSYRRWSEVLSCSETKAKSLIKQAVEKNLIYKNIGDYGDSEKEQKIQQINVYKTYPFNEAEKSNMTKTIENELASKKFKEELEFDDVIQDTITIFKSSVDEEGNSIFPDQHDYVIYLEVKEDIRHKEATKQELELIKVAEKRISILEKYPKFHKIYSAAEEEFLSSLEQQDDTDNENNLTECVTSLETEPQDFASMF